MPCATIAVVDRGGGASWIAALNREYSCVLRGPDAASVLRPHSGRLPQAVILGDPGGGTRAALRIAAQIRRQSDTIPIILVTAESSEEIAIAAVKSGVCDYFKLPLNGHELLESLLKLITKGKPLELTTASIVGDSEAIRAIVEYASLVAQTNSTVLITGETGTGKELVADLIHRNSSRSKSPFVAINCAAIPDSLLESELFGRERGAYTGADTSYDGRLKLADGGTVFFDEVGDLTPCGQAKLLRVLESRQAQRLGCAIDIPLNIRIIAATNQDLCEMVEKSQFRRDLYFRLNVTRVAVPPLRSRREDVPLLFAHFAETFARDTGRSFPGITSSAMQALVAFDWPGNVRQMRNLVEELFVRLTDHVIGPEDLPEEITGQRVRTIPESHDERTRIVSALELTSWNKKRAAQRLNWSRMTLYRKMAQYEIRSARGGEAAKGPECLVRHAT